MYSLMLSNWTTLRTPAAATTIKQSASQWLDVGDYEDFVTWLEVKEYSGATITFAYQFAPTKDDSFFVNATSFAIAATGVISPRKLNASDATTFAGRWLRYQISTSSSTASDITFRCWISANVGAHVRRTRPRCVCGRPLDIAAGRCGCGRLLRSAP